MPTYRNRPSCDTWDIVAHYQTNRRVYCQPNHDKHNDLEPKRKPDRTFRKWMPTVDEWCIWLCDLHATNCGAAEHNKPMMNYPIHLSAHLRIKPDDYRVVLARSINASVVHRLNCRTWYTLNESIAMCSTHCRSASWKEQKEMQCVD